jgi:hypothetical protein
MITVYNKATGNAVKVYDITYDRHGYPRFLIWEYGRWLRVSAKHFVPGYWDARK